MKGRIRTVKPELFTDERLWDLGEETGLPVLQAFAGLWCFADREGRFEWRPRALKTLILPYWAGDFAAVMDALAKASFLVAYEVDGKAYGCVRNFRKHQLVNQREAKSELPEPPQCTHVLAREPENVPATVRAAVFARQPHCVRCGATENLTVDHIFPKSSGGTHALTNLRTLCLSCNSARPVSGEALRADLAKDGLSMADKQRMCMHVQAHGEGNGKGREWEGSGSVAPVREGTRAFDKHSSASLIDLAEGMVRREFARRFEAAEGSMWTRHGDPGVATLAAWLCSVPGDAPTNLSRLLDAYFADPWARSQHFDVRHLARYPQKYFEPRKAPASAAVAKVDRGERIAELNSALSELEGDLQNARVEGDLERASELIERKDELIAELRKLKGAAA